MVNEFIEAQLAEWPEARERYLALGKTERRRFKIGDFEGAFQHNPARIVSTGAKTDDASVSSRKCPLCESNRPPQQHTVKLNRNWELAINPFPIFPVHLTLISSSHSPQEVPPLDMAAMAEILPGLVVFFNGSKAGASIPDHWHLQAVLKSELPLLKIAEKYHTSDKPGIMRSDMWGVDLPFLFLSALITDDEEGGKDYMQMLALTAPDAEGRPDKGLRNLFCWKGDDGLLRMIMIPRKAHRPSVYGTSQGQMLVSPGAIDMAGIVILPREEDFLGITSEKLRTIYTEVGV